LSSLPRISTIYAADLDVGSSASLDISKLQQTKTGRTYKWINIGILYDAMINIGGTDFKLLAGNYNILNMYGSDTLLVKNTVSENYNRYTVIASDYIVPMDSFTLKAVWHYKPPPVGHYLTKYHKSGTVIWMDDPSNLAAATDRWTQNIGTLALDNKSFYGGQSKSYKLTTGNVAGNDAQMSVFLPLYWTYSKIQGVECYWLESTGNIRDFGIWLMAYDGTTQYVARMEWAAAGTKWLYQDSAGAMQDIPGGTEDLEVTKAWHYVKMIVDWENFIYKKIITDSLDIAVTAALQENASAINRHLDLMIAFETGAAAATVGYINCVQLTFAEES